MSIYLYDFNDSFTLNIYSELYQDYQDIHYIEFDKVKEHLESLINNSNKSLVILGPGPGSPDDYSFLNGTIDKVLKCPQIFTLGICLGHQIISNIYGLEIDKSNRPVHGQTEEYKISESMANELSLPSNFVAQRYNSLGVLNNIKNRELLDDIGVSYGSSTDDIYILNTERLLTYQFHPESIGTNYRNLFFKRPLNFLL